MSRVPHLKKVIWILATSLSLCTGCGIADRDWPPPPRNAEERRLIEAAERAVAQFDGWSNVAWVVERYEGQWRVQAWQIVHPEAKGRMRCAPWAVRAIHFDNNGELTGYKNHL